MSDPFPALLYRLIERKGLSLREFAGLARTKQPAISEIKRGVRNPPLSSISHWADVLGLVGKEREHFIDLAHLMQTPERIRKLIRDAERVIGKSLRDVAGESRK